MAPTDEQLQTPTPLEDQDLAEGCETPSSASSSSSSDTDREEDVEEAQQTRTRKNSRRTSNSNTSGVSKRSSKKHEITAEEIRKYFDYSQSQAAHLLGISVSTLKRRFYAMGLGHKWPYPLSKHLRKKRSIAYIVHEKNVEDEKFIDTNTLNHLLKAFAQQPSSSMEQTSENGNHSSSRASNNQHIEASSTAHEINQERSRERTSYYPPPPRLHHSHYYSQQQYHHQHTQPMYFYHQPRPEHYYE